MYRGGTRNVPQSQGSWKGGAAQSQASGGNFLPSQASNTVAESMDYYSTAGDNEVVEDQYTRYDYNQESHSSSQYDNSGQYDNSVQYDNSGQFENSGQYDNSGQYEDNTQYDNTQYDNNAQYDSTQQYDNAQYENSQYSSGGQFNNKQYVTSSQTSQQTIASSNQVGTVSQFGSNAQYGTSSTSYGTSGAHYGSTSGAQYGSSTSAPYGSSGSAQYKTSSSTQFATSGSTQFANRAQYSAVAQRSNGSQFSGTTSFSNAQYDDSTQFTPRNYGSNYNRAPQHDAKQSSTNLETKRSTWQQCRSSQEQQSNNPRKTILNHRFTGTTNYAGGKSEPLISENVQERTMKQNVMSSESNMEYENSKARGSRTFSRGRAMPQTTSSRNIQNSKKPNDSASKSSAMDLIQGLSQQERNMINKTTYNEKKAYASSNMESSKNPVFLLQKKPAAGILKNNKQSAVYPQSADVIPKKEYRGSEQFSIASKSSYVQEKNDDQNMENGGQDAKKPWRRTVDGKVVKKKKTTLEKSIQLKKYVQPKNAVMCLNELIPGIIFNVEQESRTPGQPTQVSVSINGQKYHGFASSKQMAKQAAAEAALVSFVKPPSPTGSTETVEDTTPWAILASFAMFKLFNEWREGRVGVSLTNANPLASSVLPPDSMMSQTFQALLGASMQGINPDIESKVPNAGALAAYLGASKGGDAKKEDPKSVPNPAKQVPENAATLHPVMLLHQMKPNLQYNQTCTTNGDKTVFKLKAIIDNQTFVGDGANVKKAKLDLATKANKALYGIVTTYTAAA